MKLLHACAFACRLVSNWKLDSGQLTKLGNPAPVIYNWRLHIKQDRNFRVAVIYNARQMGLHDYLNPLILYCEVFACFIVWFVSLPEKLINHFSFSYQIFPSEEALHFGSFICVGCTLELIGRSWTPLNQSKWVNSAGARGDIMWLGALSLWAYDHKVAGLIRALGVILTWL